MTGDMYQGDQQLVETQVMDNIAMVSVHQVCTCVCDTGTQ